MCMCVCLIFFLLVFVDLVMFFHLKLFTIMKTKRHKCAIHSKQFEHVHIPCHLSNTIHVDYSVIQSF